MSDPMLLEAGVQMLAAAHPEQPASSWDLLHTALQEGFQNIDQIKGSSATCYSISSACWALSQLPSR